jgi:hypothetical protein
MKKVTIIIISSLLFFACTTKDKEPVQSSEEIIDEINFTLNKWHMDAAETNIEDYFEIMGEDFAFVGTDGTENWNKSEFREFCTPYFEGGSAWGFKSILRNIYLSEDEDIVWFDEVLEGGLGPCRGSGIFENVGGKWMLQQYVLSMLVPNESMKDVLEVKHENDSVFMKKVCSGF